jgi:hypothetical protein
MSTWPCPRCGTLGEIDTDGDYYQRGGRSIRCGACKNYFKYGEDAPPPSEEPAAASNPFRKCGHSAHLLVWARRRARRDSAIVVAVALGGFALNLLLLLSSEEYSSVLFAFAPPVFVVALAFFLNTFREKPFELSGGPRILVLVLALLGFAFGIALAFAPRDTLQWLGFLRG